MRRRQAVCAFVDRFAVTKNVVLCMMLLGCVMSAVAQVNTATLSGTVTDPQGLAVKAAKITVTSTGTGAQRTAVTDDGGRYSLVGLPPGEYKVTADGGPNFAVYENPSLVLTVGEEAALNVPLALRGQQQSITVNAEAAQIETTKTESSQTVEQRRINNLPINGRNYINFTLTNSQTTRDVSPTIGPAPNSGLNIGGARARSNMVSVDGADAGDNSVNGIRSTVSQEAVQEFQMILSNYNADYGRATGGVINIVTKSGTNDIHGDVFGFLRNKAFQARNPFSGQVDSNGILQPTKQAYTRTQSGLTLGGPLKKDKTFFFFSYEYTQREETGFSSIGTNNFDLAPLVCGAACGPLDGLLLTSGQSTATLTLLGAAQAAAGGGNFALAAALGQEAGGYALLMGSASSVALDRVDFGAVAAGLPSSTLNPGPGAQFPLPVLCPPGQTVNAGGGYPGINCNGFTRFSSAPGSPLLPVGMAPLPGSFVGLNSLRGNFPVMEKTSLWSARLDQRWNNRNNSFLRVGVSPSLVTGIESTSQNQVFGQNAGSRTGLNQSRDFNGTFQHDTTVSDTAFNEFRFQYARRGTHFGFSPLPGGDQVAVNIPGFAYFGREPYSPVDRIERRTEFTDHVSLIRGRHTFKIGGDVNLIQLRSSKPTIFQLDFGGLAEFSGLAAGNFLFDCVNPATAANHTAPCGANEVSLPGTTAVQSYGLGLPTTYIQGIGAANRPIDNLPFAFFFQDSWRMNRKLTMNYGVRYDVEITPLFNAGTPTNAAAEKALGLVEGIPRNYKNVAPRIGLAWDPQGDGKTVIRAGYGLFYDHPLLAIAFDATTVDGGQSVQLLSPIGTPSACGLVTPTCGPALDSPLNLNGASIFQGVLNQGLSNLYYNANQQRFDPFGQGSVFANQNFLNPATPFPLPILPFTLPVDKNFKYGYAQQANLTIEREITNSWKFSVGYQYTHGLKLYRAVDINSTDPALLTNNLAAAIGAGLPPTDPRAFSLPTSGYGLMGATCGPGAIGQPTPGGGSIVLAAPPIPFLALGFTGPDCTGSPLGFIGTPAFFNFFRPSGPNPSFAAFVGGYGTQLALAQATQGSAHPYPLGFGVPVAWNTVDAQKSIGNSIYHGLTASLTKRFSKGFEMLSSYTWSHSIDDSADLQSPLEPADSRFPGFERSNSYNDQRHRWVTSAVFQTSGVKSGDSAWKHFIGNFTVAPIIEVASGRPFNVITGGDARLDLGTSQARPSVVTGSAGTTTSKYIPGVGFTVASTCLNNDGTTFSVPIITTVLGLGCDGNLGRNRFNMSGFSQIDLRISKRIAFGERAGLDLIADGFNMLNHTNIAAVDQLCDPSTGAATCTAGRPTASYDARQFQFALKFSW